VKIKIAMSLCIGKEATIFFDSKKTGSIPKTQSL
jgi:hypothetical protein